MNRDNLLDKVRALLSKTIDVGCTEHEALASLAKARAMMDAYEISDEELQITKEQIAVLRKDIGNDPHDIKSFLANSVATFTDCKVWRSRTKRTTTGFTFCGLPSDTQFAEWLLRSLQGFVQAELVNHLAHTITPKGQRRFIINGFVAGCCGRISQRLRELSKPAFTTSSNSQALVIVKDAAIKEAMKYIRLSSSTPSQKRLDRDAYTAGKNAGDRASFGKPIGGSSVAALSKKIVT